MRSEEVGVVRGVGKRAQWILRRMAAGDGLWSEEEVQEEEDGDGEDGAEDEGPLEEGEEDQNGGDGDGQEEPLDDGEEDAHTLDKEEEDTALAEARKRVITSLGSAEPTGPPLAGKAVQDQPEEGNKASMEPQIGAMVSGPAKGENNDPDSVHATLDMIITIVGQYYEQRDLLDGRLLWEEVEWMTDNPELS